MLRVPLKEGIYTGLGVLGGCTRVPLKGFIGVPLKGCLSIGAFKGFL